MKLPIIVIALLINFSLFFLMESMISRDQTRVTELIDTQAIEFVRTAMDEELRTKDRRSPPPPKPQEIERLRADVTDIAERANSFPTQTSAYNVTSLLGEGSTGVLIGQTLAAGVDNGLDVMMADDLIPLSMLPPQYPPSARSSGVEGWVDVLFTVNERGQVSEAEVVESQPRDVFDRAATDAAMRWRFRPVTENGEAITVYGLIRMNFNLESRL